MSRRPDLTSAPGAIVYRADVVVQRDDDGRVTVRVLIGDDVAYLDANGCDTDSDARHESLPWVRVEADVTPALMVSD